MNMKIWITLAVLFPIALGVLWIDEENTILSDIAIAEMLLFFGFSVGMAVALIWTI